VRRDRGERSAAVPHDDDRTSHRFEIFRYGLDDRRHRTALEGRREVVVSICRFSAQCEEEVAGLDPPRIVGDPADLGFAIDTTGFAADVSEFGGQGVQQRGEAHQVSPSPLAVDCVSKRIVTGPLVSAKTVPGGGRWVTARP